MILSITINDRITSRGQVNSIPNKHTLLGVNFETSNIPEKAPLIRGREPLFELNIITHESYGVLYKHFTVTM